MSAKALLASARKTGGMPDEVTFRQEVMRGIAVNTFETCAICPELPRVFPSSTPDRNERGRTVFFVGAMDRWGLEVVVDGLDSQDYTSGFATGGRYAALEADDYALLKEKVITVFFKLGDFSRCQCVLGMNETRRDINLG
ncbi:hypothetical protein PHYSODRAFT_322498 [Phytophthora sojae]|uniref:Uncharacterized protein n=1 Tax=Phytophthora sojae (strain P6497) TaxID=1094619 RepID=G4YKP1_PHYSP|nr:hypothetical protein PHYSODRAFT_322498 [Phytophthora sojae]EGZ28873.1 hypothetical protein PHYSODRAFT_322498 [Phytophthora sojae]|eukprot:XP_009516148.1 hypothetical protein PHYSODRAFT_322498 [Phytophthora sojae]